MKKVWKFLSRNVFDGVLLLLFGVAAVGLFIVEINIIDTTKREESLFRALEFFIALILGWLLQKIALKEEFIRSLKDYAISAYRRISDIQKSVERFRSEIIQIRQTYPSDKIHELDVLAVLGDEMKNTVLSSSYDWADIIGDELKKLEQFQEIETEMRAISSQKPVEPDSDTSRRLLELKKELNKIRSDIPVLIQSSFPEQFDDFHRDERISTIVVDHYLSMIKSQSAIYLITNFFGDISEEEINLIRKGAPYMIMEDRAPFMQAALSLHNSSGEMLGEIINPFESSGVYNIDFVYTLMDLISQAFGWEGRGPGLIKLPDSEFIEPSSPKGNFSIRVPINFDMLVKG